MPSDTLKPSAVHPLTRKGIALNCGLEHYFGEVILRENFVNETYVNFNFRKILYEVIFNISRGCKDTEGVFGWGVCSVGG